jgi:RsiW-degrading membrane proteinase PrsW (M82 family)
MAGATDRAAALLRSAGMPPGVALELALSQAYPHLLLRSIGGIFGHGAYAGIFGYYAGLAALRQGLSVQLFARGFIIAALLHALWNATQGVNVALSIVIPLVGFLLLVACILQARKVSPARALNFATRARRAA